MYQKLTAIFFTVLLFFLNQTAFAQAGSKSGSKFSIGAAVLGGQGKMGNGQSDAPDRDMTFIPVEFFAGFNIKKLRIGVNYEYFMGNQSTDPSEVNGTNTSGTGNALGLRLEYYNGKQSFGAIYRASTSYSLEKQTLLGTSATYKGSGFSVQYTLQLKNKIGIILDYTIDNFSESLSTAAIKSNRMAIGLVFSNFNSGR